MSCQPCQQLHAPELVDARQQRDGAVPHVARVVDEAVAHLHLGVLQPGGGRRVGHLQRALPHAARAPEVLLPLLPLRVLRGGGAQAGGVSTPALRLAACERSRCRSKSVQSNGKGVAAPYCCSRRRTQGLKGQRPQVYALHPTPPTFTLVLSPNMQLLLMSLLHWRAVTTLM